MNGKSIIPWLYRLLAIAKKGLLKRGLGEENFLITLFHQLDDLQILADRAITTYLKNGKIAFLDFFSFKPTDILKKQNQELKANKPNYLLKES